VFDLNGEDEKKGSRNAREMREQTKVKFYEILSLEFLVGVSHKVVL
jgi:hypothetical protein